MIIVLGTLIYILCGIVYTTLFTMFYEKSNNVFLVDMWFGIFLWVISLLKIICNHRSR